MVILYDWIPPALCGEIHKAVKIAVDLYLYTWYSNSIKFQLMIGGNLVLWCSSSSSLGSWVIRTPTFDTIIATKLRSSSRYMDTGSFPLLAAVSWNSWWVSVFFLLDGIIWAGSPAWNNSGVLELLDCQSEAVRESFSSHSPCSLWGMLPQMSASHQIWIEQRHSGWILTQSIQLFYLSFYGCQIGLDHWPYLLQIGPRSEEILFFGMWDPVLFLVANLAAVTCSCSCISHASLLFNQTQLALVCPVSLQ